jgi:hypothetical protein
MKEHYECYGRSTVVSDLDGGGTVLNVDGGSRQELDYIEVRITEQRDKHTRGDDEMTGTLQSMPKSEREVCRDSTTYAQEWMYEGCCRGSTKYTTRTE